MDSTDARRAGGWLALLFAVAAPDAHAARLLHKERLTPVVTKSAIAGAAGDNAELAFDAFGRRFDVALEPNRAIIDAAGRLAAGSRLGIYRGRIDGAPGSWARIVVDDGMPFGLISDGTEIFGVEVLADDGGNATPYIFRLADIVVEPGTLSCSAGQPAVTAAALVDALVDETAPIVARAAGAAAEIDLGVIADFEFTDARGSGSEAALIARINNVDGIFSSQLGVQVNIGRVDTFDDAGDPFSDETDAESLLVELASYRLATPAQHANGLTHLFTGRNLDGTTVGIAYSNALCSTRYSAGLTQGTNGTTIDSLIAAHEIGHNFGAPHDGSENSACEAEPETFLMAPAINGSDQLSACSITQMQAALASATCVTPLASSDVELVATQFPASILLGDSVEIVLEVNSVGTGSVNDVSVEIPVPGSASLDGVSASSGSCTSGGGVATCAIPAIAPGTGSTIELTLTPLDPGAIDIVAFASAAIDDNPANNDVTIPLTTTAAVDVAALAPAAVEVEIGEDAAVTITIENRAQIPATGLTATVSTSDGLTLGTASWPLGPCTIDAGVARCEAATLGAGLAGQLSLGLTATATGVQSFVVQAVPAEQDRVTSNNSATGRITVATIAPGESAPPTAAGADGGGGAFGFTSLLLLVATRFRRRRQLRGR